MIAIAVGDRFGALTVQSIESRGPGKPRRAFCICDCGNEHDANVNGIFYGRTTRCRKCAIPNRLPSFERLSRRQFSNYQNGARRRGYDWHLSFEEFQKLFAGSCDYCGCDIAFGIDRQDNEKGYSVENCVPCCKPCNLAKRDMSKDEFIGWVIRIATHQGFSL